LEVGRDLGGHAFDLHVEDADDPPPLTTDAALARRLVGRCGSRRRLLRGPGRRRLRGGGARDRGGCEREHGAGDQGRAARHASSIWVMNCFISPSIMRLRSVIWYLPSRHPACTSSYRFSWSVIVIL